MRKFGLAFFLILIACFSCAKKSQENALFELMDSGYSGIDFRNDLTSTDNLNIIEYLYFYNGGGVALGDVNNDGLVDIYFTSNQGENKLYLNKGDFQFEDITDKAGVDGGGGWSTGVTMADVNGDGLLDIYVCQVGDYKGLQGRNRLYINNGDLTFSEKAAEYGIDFVGFSTHALFFDYDQDGDLDLYLLNHSIKKPEVFSHADTKFTSQDEKGGDKLFRSSIAQGEEKMEDVTLEAGILSSSLGFGLGVGIADVNQDGWLDIYVSNDFTEDDYLYINQGDGTFLESLQEYIAHTSRYSMGNDLADINQDGLPDIFTTDMLPEDPEIWMKSVGEDKQEVFDVKKRLGYGDQYVRNHLQLNRGNGKFSDIALLTNTFATDWSWSPLIFDMDNDGMVDIHITNGIVKRPNDLDFIQYSQEPNPGLSEKEIQQKQIDMLPSMKLPNYTFRQKTNLDFENISDSWGLSQASYSNGSAYADLDNDGDLDLVINNLDQEAFLYRNQSSDRSENQFIQIELRGEKQNVFGIGAQVWVFAGDQIWQQTLSTSRGFQSGGSTVLTFGLGEIEKIDSVLVSWSADKTENFGSFSSGNKEILQLGGGQATILPKKTFPKPVLSQTAISLDWKHEENTEFDEFRREYLMPRRYGTEGPAIAVGDMNGDGLDDIFLGGAKGQAASLFFQKANGTFEKQHNPFFEQLKTAEDVVAVLSDLNGDGYPDLYIGSGGNEYKTGEIFNFDRVFLNDGKGNFVFSMNSLPPIGENTSSVAIHDINDDGFPDLVVTASVQTGNYGLSPKSHLLLNDGKGRFRDMTTEYFGEDFRPGMVQKAFWADLTKNGEKELVLAGEWMPIRVFEQGENGKLIEIWKEDLQAFAGWYTAASIWETKGQNLILLGNLGLNSKLKASQEKPIWLYLHDFDGNGQEDPLIFHYMEGYLVPFASRDDLIRQIPGIKRQHTDYKRYSQLRSPEDLFDKKVLQDAKKLPTNHMMSGSIGITPNGLSAFEAFPLEAQFSPIRDFERFTNSEGREFLVAVGNFYGFRNDLGKSAAQALTLMEKTEDGWKQIPLSIPASAYWGEYREIQKITVNDEAHLIAVRNNNRLVFFKIH
ncbi:hypothetical protein A33Q_1585 [Indibacter alkaliphilus LW1]|uniref:ASPIC/UnbV domain-containing protein n=1 Tax=Indibacter alkaliphilus (strain CCUG 57479 / KCTC 22604 / LW1) TaxID=1189612 RepID=S2E6N8_INDAL|nr:VCBS repeat-containing protein [Indibacter alkaliphilus]EOZ97933.1 hypothetical protein A33Q_1585 [Indibacter alkaliphilus LW1]